MINKDIWRMIGKKRITFLKLAELFLLSGSILIMHSCIKEEFTRPVRVAFSVRIDEQYKSDDTLSFKSGEIILKNIRFDGKREAGGDYSFSTESGKKFGPQVFYTQTGSQQTIADFVMPQGIYTSMRWRFELSNGLERLDYDDNDTPGLILKGSYINPKGETINIRIEIDPYELFECLSITGTGKTSIDIISGQEYNAQLYFDPYFAFRAISAKTLEDADYSDDELAPLLLISSDSNEELYEMILFRLQQSVKIVVT
jgi:hypothetical protein